ncbi:MAG: peroxiredoxin, partial [Okeania sp. SIO2D1]|nr:peroxiredoxin [Okeania sp. SIO2D1]
MKKLGSSSILVALTTAITVGFSVSAPAFAFTFRSIDGSGNNIDNPDWGASDTQLLRLSDPAYEDDIS